MLVKPVEVNTIYPAGVQLLSALLPFPMFVTCQKNVMAATFVGTLCD